MIPVGVLGASRERATSGGDLPVSGALGWWDFSDAATLTKSGSEITAVSDKSGNARTLAKYSGVVGPTAQVSSILGGSALGVAVFPNVNQASLLGAYGAFSSGYTIFTVAAKPDASGSPDVLNTQAGHAAYVSGSSLNIWRGSAASMVVPGGAAALFTAATVHVFRVSGTTINYWLKLSGRITAAGTAPTTQGLRIGSDGANGSNWHVGEVIAYQALGDTDRETVTNHLITKWGI